VRYNLVYTNRADKDIQKLPPEIKKRIGKALLRYEQDPHRYSETLNDTKLGTYRFRIGDYRVIFDLEGSEIVVLRVGHRRDIYKKL
jgi:mRNA interferase RelE/StbE